MFKYIMNIEHDALLLLSLAVAAEAHSRLSTGLLGIGSTLSAGVYAWMNHGLYFDDIVFPAGGQFFSLSCSRKPILRAIAFGDVYHSVRGSGSRLCRWCENVEILFDREACSQQV